MHVNELFTFEDHDTSQLIESFYNDLIFEGYVDSREEAVTLTESKINKTIQDYLKRYGGAKPPEAMAFQDATNPNHYVILAAGDNMYYRFDIVNNRVVNEERYRDFKELNEEKRVLTTVETFRPVDTRSYLTKNWKKLLMWMVGGAAGVFVGVPLLFAALAWLVPAVTLFIQATIGIAALAGAGWLLTKLNKSAASSGRSAGDWN